MLSVVNDGASEEGTTHITHYFYVRTMDLSRPKTRLNTFTNVFLQRYKNHLSRSQVALIKCKKRLIKYFDKYKVLKLVFLSY